MFLRTVSVAKLFVMRNQCIMPLSPWQLLEILKYQQNKAYDRRSLVANDKNPFFWTNKGLFRCKQYIVYYKEGEEEKATMRKVPVSIV